MYTPRLFAVCLIAHEVAHEKPLFIDTNRDDNRAIETGHVLVKAQFELEKIRGLFILQ